MKDMIRNIRDTLNQSIFVGERYEKNMLGIAIGAALIVVMNLITGPLNLIHGFVMGAISSGVLILFFSMIFFFMPYSS